MDNRNLAIAVLSLTAVVLLVGLAILSALPPAAMASGMTAQGGDYVLTVGRLTTNQELVYAVDASANKLIVYGFDGNRNEIGVIQGIDLEEMRQASESGSSQPGSQGATPTNPRRGGQRPRGGRP